MTNEIFGNYVEPKVYTLAGFLRKHPIHSEDVGNTDYLRQVYLALRDEVRYVDLASEQDRKDRSNLLVFLGIRSGMISLNKGARL
jgi:hypothetical protein